MTSSSGKSLYLATCYGFCNGVRQAVTLFEQALAKYGAPIYVLHELVHNAMVTGDMKQRGTIFVQSLDDVPDGSVLLTGAHGISRGTEQALAKRNLTIIDATCPLVKRLHCIILKNIQEHPVILFGHPGHPETDGIISRASQERLFIVTGIQDIPSLPANLKCPVFLSQTTMNRHDCDAIADALKRKYPDIAIPGGVCHATWERQAAVEQLSEKCQLIIVIGSSHSSNANRLCEIASTATCQALLIESAAQLPENLSDYSAIGLTAGASTPDFLIQDVIAALQRADFALHRE